MFGTQHSYIKNIINFCNDNRIINKKKLKLLRIILGQNFLENKKGASILIEIKTDNKKNYKKVIQLTGNKE